MKLIKIDDKFTIIQNRGNSILFAEGDPVAGENKGVKGIKEGFDKQDDKVKSYFGLMVDTAIIDEKPADWFEEILIPKPVRRSRAKKEEITLPIENLMPEDGTKTEEAPF